MTENKIMVTIDYLKNLIEDTKWKGKVYAVGGCVRDLCMGLEPKDLDIVVEQEHGGIVFATWVTCRTSCHVAGSNPVVFPKYGTAKFNIRSCDEIKDVDIECVQTRKEQYHTSSRNPDVVYGTLKEDAERRDLTINSMYLNISSGEILDLGGKGMNDIQTKTIRTTNDPDIIFSDDPLRQMRVIRFATRFGWGIEKNTWLGIVKNAYRIEIISQERITDELNKILMTDKPSRGIEALYNCGLLGYVLPEVKELIGVEQNEAHCKDAFGHTMDVLDNTPKQLETRLAALFHDIAKSRVKKTVNGKVHFLCHEDVGAAMTKDIMRRMKYPNATIDTVSLLVKHHMKFKQFKDYRVPSNKVLRKFHAALGEHLNIALDLIHADNISHAPLWCMPNQINLIKERYAELKAKGEDNSKIKLPVNGNDIMEALQISKSPKIGKYLNTIKEAYLDNPNITKEECLQLVKETILCE